MRKLRRNCFENYVEIALILLGNSLGVARMGRSVLLAMLFLKLRTGESTTVVGRIANPSIERRIGNPSYGQGGQLLIRRS
jgi:hypothetical protein